MSISETKDGTLIKIYVKPNSPKFKVELNDDEIIVYSTEELVTGATSRQKHLLAFGITKNQAKQLLFLNKY